MNPKVEEHMKLVVDAMVFEINQKRDFYAMLTGDTPFALDAMRNAVWSLLGGLPTSNGVYTTEENGYWYISDGDQTLWFPEECKGCASCGDALRKALEVL